MFYARRALAVAALLTFTACADVGSGQVTALFAPAVSSAPISTPDPSPAPSSDTHDRRPPKPPPPITVRADSRTLELVTTAFCYQSACGHGMPPDPLPDLGPAAAIVVDYPLAGWAFSATFTATGQPHARSQTVALAVGADGSHLLKPVGRAGTYDVFLNGSGGGQVSAVFRWPTPLDGPLPEPEALLAVVTTDRSGKIRSYGVGLEISNLAATPTVSAATVTVTSSDGKVTTLIGERASGDPRRPPRPAVEGSVYWDSPGVQPTRKNEPIPESAVTAIGSAPFTYDVEVILDGVRHVATARWPDEELPDDQPRVRLQFTPPLPALP